MGPVMDERRTFAMSAAPSTASPAAKTVVHRMVRTASTTPMPTTILPISHISECSLVEHRGTEDTSPPAAETVYPLVNEWIPRYGLFDCRGNVDQMKAGLQSCSATWQFCACAYKRYGWILMGWIRGLDDT